MSIEGMYETQPPGGTEGYSLAELETIAGQIGIEGMPVQIDGSELIAALSNGVQFICHLSGGAVSNGHYVSPEYIPAPPYIDYPGMPMGAQAKGIASNDFAVRWDGYALAVAPPGVLASNTAAKRAWMALMPRKVQPKEAAGVRGAGGCGTCAKGGGPMSVVPSVSVDTKYMVVETMVTPLSYNAGDGVQMRFTLSHAASRSHLQSQASGRPLSPRHCGAFWNISFDTLGNGYRRIVTSNDLMNRIEIKSNVFIRIVRDENDPDKPVTAVIDPRGRSTEFTYSGGRITALTDPFGRTVQLAYDGEGNLSSIRNPVGQITGFRYDNRHRIVTIQSPASTNRIEYESSPCGLTTAIRMYDGLNRHEETRWTAAGYTERQHDGTVYATERKMFGPTLFYHLKVAEYKNGAQVGMKRRDRNGYTMFNAGKSRGVWSSSATILDRRSQILGSVDEYGRTKLLPGTTNTAAAASGTREVPSGHGAKAAASLPSLPNGQRTNVAASTSAKSSSHHLINHQVTGGYKLMASPPPESQYDRIEYYTNALGFITTYYYTNDHLLAITDALDRTTRYYYDSAWNMTCIQMPNDTTMSNVYDAMNRVVKTIQPDGIEVQTEYDLIDRPIRTIYLSETAQAGQPAINGHPYTETRYGCCGVSEAIDRAGNPAKYSYDAVARLVKVMDAMSTVVSYTYNDLDEVTALTDGNGNKTQFEYSGIGMFEETNRYLTRMAPT